ncbi:replication protein C, IncQ-type [Tepidiphilus margaritifer]|uniref:replication protein C, IncQ-type n=1 Tax=Tepidiphilus margaritifer TaxID=203471 RepID=UPI00068840E1|nr:replication protein C, IncQ-type [Tepidiphilus margaritifer]
MTAKRIESSYARFDYAHLFDGVFVPTSGTKRGRLFVPPRTFDNVEISFYGYEQLGADDQSVFLAVAAQLGIGGGVAKSETPTGDELRRKIFSETVDDGSRVAAIRTSLRAIARDAGYGAGGVDLKIVHKCLHRLGCTIVREFGAYEAGHRVDRRCMLLSSKIEIDTKEVVIAANPRLTRSIYGEQQHIKVSLIERNALESEVAKILHAWLCAVVRPGGILGRDGVLIDTLMPHVWGAQCAEASAPVRSNRRARIRDALVEIAQRTRWRIDLSRHLVYITRPKMMPRPESIIAEIPPAANDSD